MLVVGDVRFTKWKNEQLGCHTPCNTTTNIVRRNEIRLYGSTDLSVRSLQEEIDHFNHRGQLTMGMWFVVKATFTSYATAALVFYSFIYLHK